MLPAWFTGPTIGVLGVLVTVVAIGTGYAFRAFSTGDVTPSKVIISLGTVSIALGGIIGVIIMVS